MIFNLWNNFCKKMVLIRQTVFTWQGILFCLSFCMKASLKNIAQFGLQKLISVLQIERPRLWPPADTWQSWRNSRHGWGVEMWTSKASGFSRTVRLHTQLLPLDAGYGTNLEEMWSASRKRLSGHHTHLISIHVTFSFGDISKTVFTETNQQLCNNWKRMSFNIPGILTNIFANESFNRSKREWKSVFRERVAILSMSFEFFPCQLFSFLEFGSLAFLLCPITLLFKDYVWWNQYCVKCINKSMTNILCYTVFACYDLRTFLCI